MGLWLVTTFGLLVGWSDGKPATLLVSWLLTVYYKVYQR